MEQDAGSSGASETIPDGGSTMTALPEAKTIQSYTKQLAPQLRFPPGYHFLPTELELVDVYLRRKIEGRKLPLDVFMDVNLLEREPAELIAEREAFGKDMYFFFTVREECPSNKDGQPRRKVRAHPGRAAANWKATGPVREIRRPETGEVVGKRRMLTYCSGRPSEDKYSMREYVLEGSKMNQWVLCMIKEKERWNANQNRDKNASSGKDKNDSGDKDKKRKRGTDTCVEPKTTKRKKKTATSQPQETQEQQQQEITSDISSGPPPLLGHEQDDHHQALQDEGLMAFGETSSAIQATDPHEYLFGGDQLYYHGASTQQETMTWDGPGEPPLMTDHQEQVYQSSEQFHTLGEQTMLEPQFAAMAQVYQQRLTFHSQGQQQPHNTHELLPYGYGSMLSQLLQNPFQYAPKTQGFHGDITGTLQNVPPHLGELGKPPETSPSPDSVLGGPENAYPHSDSDAGIKNGIASPVAPQATSYGSSGDHQFNPIHFLGDNFDDNLAGNGGSSDVAMGLPDQGSKQAGHTSKQGLHSDITRTLQNVPPLLPESEKPSGTSPDGVPGGPDPGLPSENACPNSHSDAGMMNGIASTTATNYGSAADHQFNLSDLLGHNFDDNLAGSGSSSGVPMGLPDQLSNLALHMCQHGVQWLCGEQQGLDMGSCFSCVSACAQYH